MKYAITRRDFMNGVAIGTAASLFAPAALPAAQIATGQPSVYYPPTRTGMRGSHPGSYEVAHALAWTGQKPARHRKLGEHYDLVIVGAGLSGLAAAWFYRKQMGPRASVLLLDNHDDFGGHAKRNEFHLDGRMLLGVGGSVNLEDPDAYSDVARGLLDDLGIDFEAMQANIDEFPLLNLDADNALALPGPDGHVTVGGNWTGFMRGIGDYESAVRKLPLPASEQDKLIELFGGDRDYLDDLSLSEKYAYIESASYRQFLTERVGLAEETVPIFYPVPKLMGGPAASRYSVKEAMYLGCPDLRGMGWLGEHGFNHETDIKAITVNRWPHGYAYEYMSLDDPEWPEGQAPHEIGRARFGRISIANSDAEGRAYLDAAIDAARRAVEEQTA